MAAPPTYETSDFPLAVSLYAVGAKLLKLRWQNQRAFFVFDDLRDCEATAERYWNRDLTVCAKDMMDAYRTLKDRLFSDSRSRS